MSRETALARIEAFCGPNEARSRRTVRTYRCDRCPEKRATSISIAYHRWHVHNVKPEQPLPGMVTRGARADG